MVVLTPSDSGEGRPATAVKTKGGWKGSQVRRYACVCVCVCVLCVCVCVVSLAHV